MDSSKFIDHSSDPTKSIEDLALPSNIDLQYSKLSRTEKIIVGSKLLGMDHVPVSFEQFIKDDYFLGNPALMNRGKTVFYIWKKVGNEIYPTPINTKTPYISFGGCIGSGKSTMSKLMGLYLYHRLDCCINANLSLGIEGSAKLAYGFFHASEETAYKDFVLYYKNVFSISPYFKNLYNKPKIRLISSGPKSNAVLGTQLIFSVLSEIGFWRPQDAMNKMSEVLTRYQSRFVNKRFNFGHVIVDSSAKDADHSVADKFEEAVPEKELYLAKYPQWVARPELYKESNGQTFEFYRGDSIHTPFVLNENTDRSKLDIDRIIKCPIQTKRAFLFNPIRSLQDLAGFGYSCKELFFQGNISSLVSCSTINNLGDDVIEDIDFYNLEDTIYNRVSPMLSSVPKFTTLFVHLDIGLRNDVCGISVCYFDGEITDNDGFDNTPYPTFRVPLLFGLSRKKGQSTSLDHIFQFIQRLTIDYNVNVSADSFASAGLFQSCERAGIPYEELSVDRTTEPYFMFKNIVLSGRIKMVYNQRMLRECSELRIVTTGKNGTHVKIDHPEESSSFEFDYKNKTGDRPGTKDIADACVGSVWACYKKYSQYLEEGGSSANKQLRIVEKMTRNAREDSSIQLQNMLEDIF